MKKIFPAVFIDFRLMLALTNRQFILYNNGKINGQDSQCCPGHCVTAIIPRDCKFFTVLRYFSISAEIIFLTVHENYLSGRNH